MAFMWCITSDSILCFTTCSRVFPRNIFDVEFHLPFVFWIQVDSVRWIWHVCFVTPQHTLFQYSSGSSLAVFQFIVTSRHFRLDVNTIYSIWCVALFSLSILFPEILYHLVTRERFPVFVEYPASSSYNVYTYWL